MPGKATRELKQTRPFATAQLEAYLNIQIAADVHLQAVTALLKPHGLSAAQYNVLRILRGAGDAGLPCGEIAARMINRDPDVTRLLDRLDSRGLVTRSREDRDRRVITVKATARAIALLAKVDKPLTELVSGLFRKLSDQKVVTLISLLEESR